VKFAIGLCVALFLATFIYAATRPAAEAAAWFAALAAAVAAIGIVGAIETVRWARAAVEQARPGYDDLVRRQNERPAMDVILEVTPRGENPHTLKALEKNELIAVEGRNFDVRVHIRNQGDGVLRFGILNIQVPLTCRARPQDDPHKGHYESASPGDSGELYPGTKTPCRFTVAERDFPPGHDFLYHVRVDTPGAGDWPVAAVVDGYPAVRGWTRAVMRTS
jgi:hypothetical protein